MESGTTDCVICYNTIDKPVVLDCNHLFCEECAHEWFELESSCPLCRTAVVPLHQQGAEKDHLDGGTSMFPQLL
jgi:hypothetical protein